MTVNDMIRELMALQAEGFGDMKVVCDIISDDGRENITDMEYDNRTGEVRIF